MRSTRSFAALAAGTFLATATGLGVAAHADNAPATSTITSAATSVQLATIGDALASKPKPKEYKNCKALNKVYKHGVGKKGAKDKVKGSSKPVTNFTVDTKTYDKNKARDRDKDGIACEKR